MRTNKTKSSDNIVPIFFATDDNYLPYLSVALRSMIDNASRDYTYNIYILNSGLKDSYVKSIMDYAEAGFNIEFVNVSDKMKNVAADLDTRDYYTKTTYYRFFIQPMFPQYDKALYLDADIVIPGDISKLYNMDLGDNLIGGILEQIVASTKEFRDYSKIVLGLDYTKYFNAGIMVMNLKKFREVDIEKQFISMIKKYHFDTIAQDQDYLNFIAKDKVKSIDLSWNKEPLEDGYAGELNLIHYALFKKPWTYYGIKYEDYFWKYAEKTDFYQMLLEKRDSHTLAQKQADSEAHVNLKKRAVHICGLSHTFYNVLVAKPIQNSETNSNRFGFDNDFENDFDSDDTLLANAIS